MNKLLLLINKRISDLEEDLQALCGENYILDDDQPDWFNDNEEARAIIEKIELLKELKKGA